MFTSADQVLSDNTLGLTRRHVLQILPSSVSLTNHTFQADSTSKNYIIKESVTMNVINAIIPKNQK